MLARHCEASVLDEKRRIEIAYQEIYFDSVHFLPEIVHQFPHILGLENIRVHFALETRVSVFPYCFHIFARNVFQEAENVEFRMAY